MFLSGKPEEEAPEDPYAPPPTQLDLILADKVLQHRCKRLLEVGFPLDQARDLALDRSVDLHTVTETLVGRGCPPALAYEIVR